MTESERQTIRSLDNERLDLLRELEKVQAQHAALLIDVKLAQLTAQQAFDQNPDSPTVTKPLLRCICALERCRVALGDAMEPLPAPEVVA